MGELVVTAVGPDRPGIVAAVAAVLARHDGNVTDSAMTILGGHFTIVLLVDVEEDAETLGAALSDATADLDLTLGVAATRQGVASVAPTHVLSVYGADQPGILAGITRALADAGANVTDLSTRLLAPDDEPVYAMVVELSTERPRQLADAVAVAAGALEVDHTLRPLDTTTF